MEGISFARTHSCCIMQPDFGTEKFSPFVAFLSGWTRFSPLRFAEGGAVFVGLLPYSRQCFADRIYDVCITAWCVCLFNRI